MEDNSIRLLSWLVAMVSIVTYEWYTYSKFGVTKSISITYYRLQKPNRKLFVLTMFFVGTGMAIAGSTIMTVLAGAGLCFTGAAGAMKSSPMTMKVHVAGATSTIVLTLASAGLEFGNWYLAIGGTIGVLLLWYYKVKNHTYWLENLTLAVGAYYILLDIINNAS